MKPSRCRSLHKELLVVVQSGDLQCVERFFELQDVAANVSLWNLEHRSRRLGQRPHDDLPFPWYDNFGDEEELLFKVVVCGGLVEVFQWFFALERLVVMGDTLRAIALDIAISCLVADFPSSFEMVETLFHSPLFTEVMEDEERRSMLGTVLKIAASRGLSVWVQFLMGYGADPNFKHKGVTPLAALAERGNTKTLDLLISHGSWMEGLENVLFPSDGGWNIPLVDGLLRYDADCNMPSHDGAFLLHQAAYHGAAGVIRRLIVDRCADVDARDRNGRTPLMLAVAGCDFYGHPWSRTALVNVLLDCGANIRAVDSNQRGILHYAVRAPNLECVRLCWRGTLT